MQLPCPNCGCETASIDLMLGTIPEDPTFRCQECDSEFTTELVRQFISRWTPVLKWISTAPKCEE